MSLNPKKWFTRHPKTRLKPPEQMTKGARVFFNRPAVGRIYWVFVWLSALLLTITVDKHGSVLLSADQLSPITVITSVEFHFPHDLRPSDSPGPAMVRIPEGTVLVERGEKVTPETAAKVRAYQRFVGPAEPLSERLFKIGGDALILLLGMLMSATTLYLIKPDIFRKNSMILLFLLISLLTIIPSKWCFLLNQLYVPVPLQTLDYLLPLALAPLLAAILMGPLPAIVMGFWVSFAVSVLSGYSFIVFTIGFAAAVVVARMTRFVRTRATVFRMGLCAGLAGAACALGFSAITLHVWDAVVIQCLLSVVTGILSALIALLILPLLEILFGISTDISLLELSDMEHPLLKRLSIEAPGTYHHSLMVANLSQAAIAAIGGNALRASICAYFHDIGKLVKPTFFSENTQFTDNPHDDLSPSMSTLVVISHVKEGVNLALRYKLPQPVVDAIQQHHGTGLVYYFFHKAKTSTQMELDLKGKETGAGTAEVSEEDYRYPGPRPRSREAAVLCIADSVEAGSRSLEKISTSHIEHLVDDIVDGKVHDGQLDLCGLTLTEISRIKKVFVFTLTNMLHGRISYPNNENRSKQQTVVGQAKLSRDQEADSVSNGTGQSP
ncbi:HDIG domain-containing metalloprotein [Verrucomicrobiota bacterium]